MKAVPRIELCAGHKVQIKGLQKYIKYSNGTLAPSAGRKNRSGKNQPGYYLGKYYLQEGQGIWKWKVYESVKVSTACPTFG